MNYKKTATAVLASLMIVGCGGGTAAEVCNEPGFFSLKEPREKYRSLNDTQWGYSKSGEVVYKGKVAERFEVRSGDCAASGGWSDCANDRERSELIVMDPKIYNEKMFISWNIYIPDESKFQTSHKVKTTIGQVHTHTSWKGTAGGLPSGAPILMFYAVRDTFGLCNIRVNSPTNITCDEYDLGTISSMRNNWTEIILEVDTNKETGYAKVWKNQELVVNTNKPVTAKLVNEDYWFFKYGIYRSFVTRHGAPMPTQILYYDEVRMGKEFDHVSTTRCDMDPLN